MTGLDTNVIVRYLTQDDPIQSAAASKIFDEFTADAPGFVSVIALVELVWVLQSSYHVERSEAGRVIETLLRTRELVVEQAELIWQSLRLFTKGSADFADCLIERSGHAVGCNQTVTFDRGAARSAGMKLLG